MPRPKTHDDALRENLLARAGELLAEEGPQGLSLRRLAAEVGTSTTAVYSLFGSKPALIAELCAEGFRRIGDQLGSMEPTGDPLTDLVRLGLIYREAALAQRHVYPIMFAGASPGGEQPAG
ncbi:TetR/AcrR family transcriptional regulator, partial [Klebsiella pneumoniae]